MVLEDDTMYFFFQEKKQLKAIKKCKKKSSLNAAPKKIKVERGLKQGQ